MWSLISGYITPTVIKWGLIVGACAGLYFYIGHLRSENTRLITENIKLEDSIKEQKETIKKMEIDHAAIVKARDDMTNLNTNLQKETQALKDKFDREGKNKKSLSELARKKSTLIEKLINRATEKVLRCFETVTSGGAC